MFVARTRVVGHFVHPAPAQRCFADLRRGQLLRPGATIWVKPHRSLVEIAYTASDARVGLMRGLALGGLVGFLGAAAIGAVTVQALGVPTALAWLAASVGLLAGAVLGALFARPAPHPALAVLEADPAPTITVETTDEEDREWAADRLARGHARVERGAMRLHDRRGPVSLRHA